MMIALDLYSTASAERTFVSVISLSLEKIPRVKKTIACWRALLDSFELGLRKMDPVSEDLMSDLELWASSSGTLYSTDSEIDEILTSKDCPIKGLLAIDSLDEIQAIAIYWCDQDRTLRVNNLITAPSNIKWKTILLSPYPRTKGGGTILIHALLTISRRDKIQKICLSSLDSAILFYKKFGVEPSFKTYFVWNPSDESHYAKIEAAFKKVFGHLFSYSLLLTDGVE